MTRISDIFDQVILIEQVISERTIIVNRNNVKIKVDLVKYHMFGDKEFNPFVQQGDIIEFKISNDKIRIYGGIKLPGEYEFVYGETLEEIIILSGGLSNNADANNIEITRFIDDISRETIMINDYDLSRSFYNVLDISLHL